MGLHKDRPGAKVVREHTVLEKPHVLLRGSKVGKAAWEAAEEEERPITDFMLSNVGIKDADFLVLHREMLLRRASFHREVALALERLAKPVDFTCWLAMILSSLEQQGKPKPTKAEALERLAFVLSPNVSRSDALKQLRRAESYLGEKLPKARPGAKRKS